MTLAGDAEVRALAQEPLSADQQTRLHSAIWARRAEVLDLSITVPPCPYDDDALRELRRDDRAVAYLPHELSSHMTRHRFAALFPAMASYAVPPVNGFVNTADAWGWFDYDAATDASWLDLDEPRLAHELAEVGRTMLTLDQYIVAAQDHHLITGIYLDQTRTWSRLATTYDGRTIAARFDGEAPEEGREDEPPAPGALLVAYDLVASDNGSMLGVRTRSARQPRRPAWEDLLARTTNAYVEAGFPSRLGMSTDDYLRSLPGLPAQPEEYAGRFDIPLLVDPRISWQEQAEMLGVRVSNHSRRFSYEPTDPDAIPEDPYVAWFHGWSTRFPEPVSSIEARVSLAEDELGATPFELLAMNAALPDLARTARFFEAIGFVNTTQPSEHITNRSAGRCLSLYHWRRQPEIGSNQHPIAYPMYRPLVRGRHVTTAADRPTEDRT